MQTLSVVSPLAAGLAVFLTAAVTWAFDIEEPSAFSTALLALLIPTSTGMPYRPLVLYVVFTAAASATVVSAFVLWRDTIYERRADILYRSTESANRVLVPSLGDETTVTAMLAGCIAGETGTVVLVDVVDSETVASAERDLLRDSAPSATAAPDDAATRQDAATLGLDTPETDEFDPAAVAAPSAARLEGLAASVTAATGAQCEQVVATGESPAEVIDATALELDCDLVATTYEESDGQLSPFITSLFRGSVDVLAHEPVDRHRREWSTVLVPVRRASDVAHEMLAFAGRLAEPGGVTLATCIGSEGDRRRAESMLANLAETCEFDVETRVSRQEVEPFIERTAPRFDLVLMGASRDRSTASRIVSPPTFKRVGELEADMAVLDRNVRY
ncbi:MAG: HPP family protein [Halobacteriales archaeon]|nr:HPP family protein [Halobacteriales archaeon]